MYIENIINRINNANKSRSGFYFELLIQNLLKLHFSKQGKNFITDFQIGKIRLDGYIETGIDIYDGPIGFEIKYVHQMNCTMMNSMLKRFTELLHTSPIKYIIIICLSPSIGVRYKEITNKSPKIIFWDNKKIDELIEENADAIESIVNSLFKLDIENEIRKSSDDWKKSRLDILNEIKKAYKKGNMSLLLGAGVSCSAGFPNWRTLLNSLYANFVNKVFNNDVVSDDTLQSITKKFIEINNSSTLAAARYLKAGLSQKDNDVHFITAVKKALYDSPKKPSPLMDAIINLCTPKRSGAKIKSVITYNFDDLVEEYLDKVKLEYKTIYKDEEQHDSDELPIYHVHGFISSRGDIEKDVSLIFSEEAYHKVYSEPYHWSNLVQLATLRENNCLMIGLSLSDPNLRRLLEIAAQKHSKNNRHYVFMQRLSNDDLIDEGDKERIDIISANKIIQTHHVVQEMMMSSLGTNIIWFEDYDEIPKLLDSIKK